MAKRLLSACIALLALAAPAAATPDDSTYRTDDPVEFTLSLLGGAETLSLSELRGQWVVLNYWATWCRPCREEIPELSELHEQRDDITVLGLAYEEAEPETFQAFLEEFDASYPMLLVDVYAPPEPFGAPRVLPTSVILDPTGRAVKGFAGPVTRERIETFIDGED
jgi:thiol-disulfide isomerase/thioredoxin